MYNTNSIYHNKKMRWWWWLVMMIKYRKRTLKVIYSKHIRWCFFIFVYLFVCRLQSTQIYTLFTFNLKANRIIHRENWMHFQFKSRYILWLICACEYLCLWSLYTQWDCEYVVSCWQTIFVDIVVFVNSEWIKY